MKTNSSLSLGTLLAPLLLLCLAAPLILHADEGMWTFDNFPSQKVKAKYGFAPSQAWLDHVRASSLRIAGGCSASFISPQGLVMTNHHCVLDCVQQLSTAQQNLVETGFAAVALAGERECPAFELDQLTQIRDVTEEVQKALAGKTGDAANTALHAKEAELQQSCGSDPHTRCDVVSLYEGGIYDLYRYRRYDDVRLVFAPEMDVAQFGGDPDNFNFPRFDYDIGLVRAYEDGHPAASPDYLKWSADGSKDGDMVFVSGNPGGTSRDLTVSQLAFARDESLPSMIPALSEYRGLLERFVSESPERAQEANEQLFFIENSFKVGFGRQQALLDPEFFGIKVREERRLRQAIASEPKLAADKSAWDDIAKIQTVLSQLWLQHETTRLFSLSNLFGYALDLVRAAAERTKPNGERLPEYTDQALVQLQ